jgi:hypothetical protein
MKSTFFAPERKPSPVGRGGDATGRISAPDAGDTPENPERDLLRWIPTGDKGRGRFISENPADSSQEDDELGEMGT